MEKKMKLLVGGAAAAFAVAGGITFALQGGLSNSPKDQFIKRMTDLSTVQKAGSKYELSFEEFDLASNPYSSLLNDFKISGESHTDGKNVDLTIQFSKIFGQELPQAHFIYANKAGYINAELLPQFIMLYASFAGTGGTSPVSDNYEGKFIGIEDFIKMTGGAKEAERFNKEMDSALKNQTAFQKEIQTTTMDYLKKVDSKNYFTKDDNVVLALKKDDVKGMVKTLLTTMSESKHYDGDKEGLKKLVGDFDVQYDKTIGQLEQFEIDIMYSKTKRDSQVKLIVEEKDGVSPFKVILKLANQEIAYKEPQAPSKDELLSEDAIQKLMEEIGNRAHKIAPQFSTTIN